jgi:hypothetical protein
MERLKVYFLAVLDSSGQSFEVPVVRVIDTNSRRALIEAKPLSVLYSSKPPMNPHTGNKNKLERPFIRTFTSVSVFIYAPVYDLVLVCYFLK